MNEHLLNKVLHGDCFEYLPQIEDKSISAIIADLPYGITSCKWDTPLDLEKLWNEYERIIKDNGAIVLFASQPFTSALIMSNPRIFKYSWVWDKVGVSNSFLAKKQPLRQHEDIAVFYKKQPIYNPQMTKGKKWHRSGKIKETENTTLGKVRLTNKKKDESDLKFPKTIISVSNADKTKLFHNTQKPIKLIEYLVKTYSNEGDVILDNTAGSGTLGVACINTNRTFILMEKEWEYCLIANERIKEARLQNSLKK